MKILKEKIADPIQYMEFLSNLLPIMMTETKENFNPEETLD